MKVLIGNTRGMREVSVTLDRYVDIVSMDGTISVRVIIEKGGVVIVARSGTMTVEHQYALPAVRVEKSK